MRIRILLTGKSGQVGFELQQALAPLGEVIAFDHQQFDLSHIPQLHARIRDLEPQVIVNAAAYTAVDRAESEPDLAMQINAAAPAAMAQAAKQVGALLVHYSTDYVFDGGSRVPYREDDSTNPLNVYGKTKLAGESAIRSAGASHLIFRTSWVYGGRGRNFLLTILRLAREREELTIVNDQIGAPTWSRDIAQATARIISQMNTGKNPAAAAAKFSGTYNLTAAGETSWFGFAEFALLSANLLGSITLRPLSTGEYNTSARRPLYSVLDSSRLKKTFGLDMPGWKESALKVCHEISASAAMLSNRAR